MLKRKSTWKEWKPKLRIPLKRSGINRATKQRRAKVLKERLWANEVKKRDGCCQRCGATRNLHAHHRSPRSRRPDLKFQMENGVTLCNFPAENDCHGWVHSHIPEATAAGWLSDVPYEQKEAA